MDQKKIKSEIRKYVEGPENESTKYHDLWDIAKAVLRGKFLAINVHIKKQERSQINNLTLQLKVLEKEEKTKAKATIREKIIKHRREINETEK